MDPAAQIRGIITALKQQSKSPQADKKWLNKTIARLEEAELFASKIYDGRVLGIPTPDGTVVNPVPTAAGVCICPSGVVNQKCPIHGSSGLVG